MLEKKTTKSHAKTLHHKCLKVSYTRLCDPFIFSHISHSVLPSYRNQSIDLDSKSIDWFLYEGTIRNFLKYQIILKTSLLVIYADVKKSEIMHTGQEIIIYGIFTSVVEKAFWLEKIAQISPNI